MYKKYSLTVKRPIQHLSVLYFALLLISCADNNQDVRNPQSLLNVTYETAGANCSNGGIRIETGVDLNNDGKLGADEVTSTSFVCNGDNSGINLVDIEEEPAGENCASGGYLVNSGIDNNQNGVLDDSEIIDTKYICRDYLSYAEVVNQSGTEAPSGNIVYNSLNLSVTWSRSAQGKFQGTFNKSLDLTRTILITNNRGVKAQLVSPTTITLENKCGDTYCDGFSYLSIEVRYYF